MIAPPTKAIDQNLAEFEHLDLPKATAPPGYAR
jgi:hypothetical protein